MKMREMLARTDCPDYWNVNYTYMNYWSKKYPQELYVRETFAGVTQKGNFYRFDVRYCPVELKTRDGKVIRLTRDGEIVIGEDTSQR